MAQASLFPVSVVRLVAPSAAGVDGADLKWLALGDDGNTYAMKTLADHPALPLTEWVCYRLWQACGMVVPECVVLHHQGQPPAFGSRFELSRQLHQNPDAYTIAGFFRQHMGSIGALYPLDAFITNNDRHGRNMLLRQTVTGDVLVSIDFSRAAMVKGKPFGRQSEMKPSCNTAIWWRFFRDRMSAVPDLKTLDAAATLPPDWIGNVMAQAPPEWRNGLDTAAIIHFWNKRRSARIKFAKAWL